MIFYSGLVWSTTSDELSSSETSLSSTLSTSIDSTSELTSLTSTRLSSKHSSGTTARAYYQDTYSPGSIAGIIIGSILFIFIVSLSSYYIRRRQLVYLPYNADDRQLPS